MTQLREHLWVMNSPISDSRYISIIISSMLETYHPTIQTVKTMMKVIGTQILPNDLITIILQEAEYHTIKTGWAKQAEAAMSISSSVKK
jgi:hypothetical protein